jgi:hypothetical protein
MVFNDGNGMHKITQDMFTKLMQQDAGDSIWTSEEVTGR